MKAGILILFFFCSTGQVCTRPGVTEKYGDRITSREIIPVSNIPGTAWIDDQAEEFQGEAKESHASIIVFEHPGKETRKNLPIRPVIRLRLDPLFLDRPPPPLNFRG